MQARALKRVMQLPKNERLNVIAEGLGLLSEHVSILREDLAELARARRPRGFAALLAQSDEEAAKVLILLDFVRMDWKDTERSARQLKWFYGHLQRCIYAEIADMRPATFGEVHSLVNLMRQEFYLDGPTGVDWIFSNELVTRREDTLYVDYVHDEDGERWSTPARFDTAQFGYLTSMQDLVVSMHKLGFTSRAGLEVIADTWADVEIDDTTHWQVAAALNREVVERLDAAGLVREDAGSEDAHRVIDRWGFPLGGLELQMIPVEVDELRAERDRRIAEWGMG